MPLNYDTKPSTNCIFFFFILPCVYSSRDQISTHVSSPTPHTDYNTFRLPTWLTLISSRGGKRRHQSFYKLPPTAYSAFFKTIPAHSGICQYSSMTEAQDNRLLKKKQYGTKLMNIVYIFNLNWNKSENEAYWSLVSAFRHMQLMTFCRMFW